MSDVEKALLAIRDIERNAPNRSAARERLMEVAVEATYLAEHVAESICCAACWGFDASDAATKNFAKMADEIERLRGVIKNASEIAGMGRKSEACEMLYAEVYSSESKEGEK